MSFIFAIKFYIKKYFFPLFLLSWISLVGGNYFVRYTTYYLVLKAKEILLFIMVVFFIWAMGKKILKRISLHTVSFLENNIFALGLGLGFWGYCIFFLGILGGLYSELVLGLFIVSSVFCFKEIRQIISEIKSVIICKKFSFSPWTAILIFAFILSFFASLGPVISTDALRYHLSIPNLYFLNHKIFILPNNFFSNFPALFDMLYLFTFFLKSSGLARMFHCLAGVLTALSIYSLGKKYFNFRTGILAALIFFTTPFVLLLSSVAFIDLGVAFFFFLSFYALFIYDEKKKINYLVVSAVFAGLSVSTKYSGGLFVLIAGILYFFKRYTIDKVKFSFAFRELIIFFGITLIVVSPWLLRNLFCVKNPVYPFFSGNNDLYMKILSSAGININKLNWFWLPLVVPWHITLYVSHFENWRAGMVYLAFLPFLFFLKGVDRKIKYLIIYCVLVYLIWVYGIQNVRFLLPVFPLLGIIIAYLIFKIINIVENSRSSCRVLIFFSKQFNFFIKGILSFIFVWNILHFLVRSPYLLPQLYLFWGRISRVDYLRVEIPFYEMFQYINRNLSPSAKILFLGHYHDGGYLKRNYLYSSEFEKPLLFSLIDSSNNIEELLNKLKTYKITHLLFDPKKLDRVSFKNFSLNSLGDKKEIFDDFFDKNLENIYQKNNILLYRVKYGK